MIMDMELDLSEDSKDLDAIAVGRKTVSGVSVSSGLWKFHILSLMSSKVCLSDPCADLDYTRCSFCTNVQYVFQSLILLGDLLNRVAENDLFDWSGRSKLIDYISNFILVRPHIGQVIVVTEITCLKHSDAHDLSSNFGAKFVVPSKEKVVTAEEVLAAVPQHRPTMETIIITLVHLAMFSEKIKLEDVVTFLSNFSISTFFPFVIFALRGILNILSEQ
ncbi:hypothetical protein RHMOL_Rhmol02G0180000 [Rhododendron molle]|uniref:Uncharacterized protein n=1 Tax=Rhododendron molle TaxID=49168 RepID=A0ACC0PUI4_RHOML|nr:hypothetical protein RHMOL_Rhmol02G0180000 [Rhododendron molle]